MLDVETIKTLKTWGVATIIFCLVAIVCIGFIFAPVKIRAGDTVLAASATTLNGLVLMAESWKTYPNYTIGLGIAAALSFSGAIYCAYIISRKGEVAP